MYGLVNWGFIVAGKRWTYIIVEFRSERSITLHKSSVKRVSAMTSIGHKAISRIVGLSVPKTIGVVRPMTSYFGGYGTNECIRDHLIFVI
jgi:hypothetical protein